MSKIAGAPYKIKQRKDRNANSR